MGFNSGFKGFKRNGTNTPHAKTPLIPDTRLLHLPLHTLPTILNRPLPVPHSPIGLTSPCPIPSHGINGLAFPYTTQTTSSLWRWNWYMVPKRRQITYWRRANTQSNIYNIQITAKAWNLQYTKNKFCIKLAFLYTIKLFSLTSMFLATELN